MAAGAAAGSLAVQVAALKAYGCLRSRTRRAPSGGDAASWNTRAVRNYVVFGALAILGAGMATPFYSVYFINDLHSSPEMATTGVAVANATVMLAQGVWGRIIDRHGFRLVGAGSPAAIATVPLLWLAARGPLPGLGLWLFNGLMWAASCLATLSLLLSVSNDANRASVVAWVNALQAPANFGAPLIGGFLAEQAGLPALFGIASVCLALSGVYFVRSFPPLAASRGLCYCCGQSSVEVGSPDVGAHLPREDSAG